MANINVLVVECAHIRHSSFLKPSPYVELTVDNNKPRRTEIVKNTAQPKWNENITVLVTQNSLLHFTVLDHNNFRKDTTIGEKKLELQQLIPQFNGRTETIELTLDLMSESKTGDAPTKTGELITVLHGLNIDVSNCVPSNHSRTAISNGSLHRSVLNGVRAQIRFPGQQVGARNSRPSVDRPSIPTSHSSNNVVPNGTIGPPVTIPAPIHVNDQNSQNGSDEPLPPGWEMRFDTYGRCYYVDHNTR